jgi:hypothetical protein
LLIHPSINNRVTARRTIAGLARAVPALPTPTLPRRAAVSVAGASRAASALRATRAAATSTLPTRTAAAATTSACGRSTTRTGLPGTFRLCWPPFDWIVAFVLSAQRCRFRSFSFLSTALAAVPLAILRATCSAPSRSGAGVATRSACGPPAALAAAAKAPAFTKNSFPH